MRSRLRLPLVAILLVTASVTAAGTAGAAPSQAAGDEGADTLAVTASASGNPDQAVFDYSIDNFTCDSSTVTVAGVDATVTQADPNAGTISFPVGTPGGVYTATFDCDTGKGVESGSLTLSIAAVTVTKVVQGEVPDDATFAVTVSCAGGVGLVAQDGAFGAEGGGFFIDTSFSFGPTGGSKYLVAYTPQGCTVSETDDGGAIDSALRLNDCNDGGGSQDAAPVDAAPVEAAGPTGTFDVVDPTDCTQTIANVFAAPAAQPADVVQQQPAFTG